MTLSELSNLISRLYMLSFPHLDILHKYLFSSVGKSNLFWLRILAPALLQIWGASSQDSSTLPLPLPLFSIKYSISCLCSNFSYAIRLLAVNSMKAETVCFIPNYIPKALHNNWHKMRISKILVKLLIREPQQDRQKELNKNIVSKQNIQKSPSTVLKFKHLNEAFQNKSFYFIHNCSKLTVSFPSTLDQLESENKTNSPTHMKLQSAIQRRFSNPKYFKASKNTLYPPSNIYFQSNDSFSPSDNSDQFSSICCFKTEKDMSHFRQISNKIKIKPKLHRRTNIKIYDK